MKYKILSIVTGTEACFAKCPFCVSGCKPTEENLKEPKVDWNNFETAVRLALNSGVGTAMLTSRGEPLLFPEMITRYLKAINKRIPIIELQTNGAMIEHKTIVPYLRLWKELGLNIISISTHDYREEKNQEIYGKYSLESTVNMLHKLGFSVRLTCIAHKQGINSIEEIKSYLDYTRSLGVFQTSIRPLNYEDRRESAKIWCEENQIDRGMFQRFFDTYPHIKELLKLNKLGTVYSYKGQNVFYSNPLNSLSATADKNAEEGRQLIFFPDGRLMYEWEEDAARIL